MLSERREPLALAAGLGDWQPITVKFSGDVIQRQRDRAFKGAMFAAYAGDLVLSKIDARNGAVGLIPASIPKAVVTTEYPVLIPDPARLCPEFLHHLLRAEHFKVALRNKASGTSGRKRVTVQAFLSLEIPLPTLTEQDALLVAYAKAIDEADTTEAEAHRIETEAVRAFEQALGVTPPSSLPHRPVFIARFKDFERWSHEGMLRGTADRRGSKQSIWATSTLGEVIEEVRHGCSASPSKIITPLRVLKISAVTKGEFNAHQYKFIADRKDWREQFSLKKGDVLLCRTNGTLAYVGMSALVRENMSDTIYPDKVMRLRIKSDRLDPAFLWRLLQVNTLRRQIEAAARTAVGNFAIGSADVRLLQIPLPPLDVQQQLSTAIDQAKTRASGLREAAAVHRQAAWAAFESALFEHEPAENGACAIPEQASRHNRQ